MISWPALGGPGEAGWRSTAMTLREGRCGSFLERDRRRKEPHRRYRSRTHCRSSADGLRLSGVRHSRSGDSVEARGRFRSKSQESGGSRAGGFVTRPETFVLGIGADARMKLACVFVEEVGAVLCRQRGGPAAWGSPTVRLVSTGRVTGPPAVSKVNRGVADAALSEARRRGRRVSEGWSRPFAVAGPCCSSFLSFRPRTKASGGLIPPGGENFSWGMTGEKTIELRFGAAVGHCSFVWGYGIFGRN